jgi:hypothetical protein
MTVPRRSFAALRMTEKGNQPATKERRFKSVNKLLAGIIFIAFSAHIAPVWAGSAVLPTISWYETSTAGGTENSNTFATPVTGGASILYSIACYNYDTSNPKVVMLFDAASVPANGTVATRGMIPLAAATSANQPSYNSLGIAQGGLPFRKAVTFAASTTGKTLTVDTTSGGNIHCAASYSPYQF